MERIILVAHGRLAVEMKNSAEMIMGELPAFIPLTFLPEEGPDSLAEKIAAAVAECPGETLILTDIFCGSPYNASCAVALGRKEQRVAVLCGMSLPLVLEMAARRETSTAEEMTQAILEISQDTVKSFNPEAIEDEEEL